MTAFYICFSEIYCSGLLLEAAQNAHIYKDSKSFVDMKMKYEPGELIVYAGHKDK